MAKISTLDLLINTFEQFLESENYIIYKGTHKNSNYAGYVLKKFDDRNKEHLKAKKELSNHISDFFDSRNSYGPSLSTMMIFLKYLLKAKKANQIKSVIGWYHPTEYNDREPFEYITKLLSRYDNKGLADYLARPSIANRLHFNKLKKCYSLLKNSENKERVLVSLIEHRNFKYEWYQISVYDIFKELNVSVDKYKDRFDKINFEANQIILGSAIKKEILEIPFNRKDLMSLGVDLKTLNCGLDSAFNQMIEYLNENYTELFNIEKIEITEYKSQYLIAIVAPKINKDFMYLFLNNLIEDLKSTTKVTNIGADGVNGKIVERVYSKTQKDILTDFTHNTWDKQKQKSVNNKI